MFASINTENGSDLPLWAVQDDFEPGVSTVNKFFGGWTSAYAKQYHLSLFMFSRYDGKSEMITDLPPLATSSDLPLCSASVDLDSFSA